MHVVVLCLPPIPQFVSQALCDVKPNMLICVPLVLVKLKEEIIGEFVSSKTGVAKIANISQHKAFARALKTILMSELGDNIERIVTGGSPLPEAVESLFMDIDIPIVTAYGLTECAPIISIGKLGNYKKKECGTPVSNIVCKILSDDPQTVPGELLVKGPQVFKGYYNNPDADKVAFTEDGWFRTGDMAILDSEYHLFLVGRCKNMLLTTNGQNVFPEEIEFVLNKLPYVAESLIVQRENKFIALIVPDSDKIGNDNIDAATLSNIMTSNIQALNKKIPAYSAVIGYEIMDAPFAKTAKGSIKRFLYS